jgi:hypothetical protein
MLALLAFILFLIAAILRLVGTHASMVIWLIIIGGACVSAAVAWGWAGPRYVHRSGS